MDFVTVREFRTAFGKVWQKLESERELVITRNGKPVALLTATKSNHLEDDLRILRRAKAEAAIEAMQRASVAKGLDQVTLKEINAEIAATRERARAGHARRR